MVRSPSLVPAAAAELRLRDRIVAGDRAAASDLVAQHLEALYRFVHYRAGGERQRVEDLVQDVFLTALERMASFDGRAGLHEWLRGIARNKLRAARRERRPRLLADVLDESDAEIDAILAQVSREPLPEHVLEAAETRDLVGATLASLPPDYARALVQKYVEGLSLSEMAGGSGRSEKATESLLARARTSFARVLELLARKRGGLS